MSPSHHLALLLAAPRPGEAATLADQAAMNAALLARGLPPDRILALHGRLDRPLVTAFLQAAGRRVAGWDDGSVFVHVSGDGFFAGDTAEEARPGLLFSDSEDVTDDNHLLWDDVFAALALPAGVGLTLLPDL